MRCRLAANLQKCCHLQEHIALSADSTLDPKHMVNFPLEFLHTISPGGLPPHQLRLKVGMPIMIRNLDQSAGQAIFVIKHIRTHVLQATITTRVRTS